MPRDELLNWEDMSIHDILELAIVDEEEARSYYTRAAGLAGNPHTRATLLRLAEMERGHAQELRAALEELEHQHEAEAGMAD